MKIWVATRKKKATSPSRLPRAGFLRLRRGGAHNLKRRGFKGYVRDLDRAYLEEAIADFESEEEEDGFFV